DPLNTAQTTGSSRLTDTPETCCAFSARSSPNTPAVFLAATLVMTDTSSKMVAMSSNNAKKLLPAIKDPSFEARARILQAYKPFRGKTHARIITKTPLRLHETLHPKLRLATETPSLAV